MKASHANRTGHWIQVSGATVLSIPDIASGTYGEKSDKVYSDVDGADEVRQLIQQNSAKRVVDNKLLNLTGPKTALVFPPIIYGQGRGPIKQRSVQIPELARAAIQNRKAIQVGKGESTWSNVHISDISDIFVRLVEKAVQGADDSTLWNRNGLYFAGNAMLNFKGISQLIAKAAHSQGLTEDTAVAEISHEEADNVSGHAGILWGTNARQISQRARQLLGWAPKGIALDEEIPYTVRIEAARL
jgi:nucleoside-diphosphate-sugar epimerase